MKLAEVIQMFALFGFAEEHVKQALSNRVDAADGYEDLKRALIVRFGDMCLSEPVAKMKELKPVYQKLLGLKLTKAVRKGDEQRKDTPDLVDALRWHQERIRRKNTQRFVDAVREEMNRREIENLVHQASCRVIDDDEDMPN